MDIEKKLTHQAFLNREQSISHLAYERENAFFKAIQDGDVQEMRRLYQPFEISEMGKLSNEPLRNLQYHLIITVALITRACIEGGMEMEEAYNLSDIYIHSIDRCKEAEEVRMLHMKYLEHIVSSILQLFQHKYRLFQMIKRKTRKKKIRKIKLHRH